MTQIELEIAIAATLLNIAFIVLIWNLKLSSFVKEWRLIFKMAMTAICVGVNVVTIARFLELAGR